MYGRAADSDVQPAHGGKGKGNRVASPMRWEVFRESGRSQPSVHRARGGRSTYLRRYMRALTMPLATWQKTAREGIAGPLSPHLLLLLQVALDTCGKKPYQIGLFPPSLTRSPMASSRKAKAALQRRRWFSRSLVTIVCSVGEGVRHAIKEDRPAVRTHLDTPPESGSRPWNRETLKWTRSLRILTDLRQTSHMAIASTARLCLNVLVGGVAVAWIAPFDSPCQVAGCVFFRSALAPVCALRKASWSLCTFRARHVPRAMLSTRRSGHLYIHTCHK